MNTPNGLKPGHATSHNPSRRSFVRTAALAGAAGYAALASPRTPRSRDPFSLFGERSGLRRSDRDILVAAEIAEALAVTTYSNIINSSPFFKAAPRRRPGLPQRRRPGRDVALSPRAVRHRPAHALQRVLLPAQHVLRRTDHAQHSRHSRGRIHRRLSRRRAQLQHAESSRHLGAHHGDRERPPHTRARRRRRRDARRSAVPSNTSPASRASPKASTRQTTTATRERSAGPRSIRPSTRSYPSSTSTRRTRQASTPRRPSPSNPSPQPCPHRSVTSSPSAAAESIN